MMDESVAKTRIEDLQNESERLGGWIALLSTEKGKHGKFLKGEWHRRLAEIKDSYHKIDTRNPSKDAVVQQLVMIQTEEKMVANQLDDLKGLQIRKNELDKTISSLIQGKPSEEIPNPLIRQPE